MLVKLCASEHEAYPSNLADTYYLKMKIGEGKGKTIYLVGLES